ncbi:RNA helicase [Caerostris darwini]|uniref:RNA helicase n=1 Tax=Caerostris darwini TaxID=1538125 RepID=A0AAV4TUU3_9ARAC|nr:RNA helicase [Caerostris darwini]
MCMLDSNPIIDEFIDKYIPRHEKINIISNAKRISCKKKFITYNSKVERDNSIVALLENNKSSQGLAVIFGYSRDPLNELYSFLKFQNFSCEILTGGLTTCQRKVVLEGFNENKIKVLITTYSFLNVIEAKNITMVINYEQKLNYEKLEICEETESLLSTGRDNLIVNYVEKKWEEFLIKQLQCQSEEQLFANATIISANALSLSNC